MAEHYLGIDTGGTFTDFAYLHQDQLITHKRLSTPSAPEVAILDGIEQLGLTQLCEQGKLIIIHGTTVATNAALESRGVKTAYICNQGLGDVLEIGRQNRRDLYQLLPSKDRLNVPGDAIFELDVRRDAKGKIKTPLKATDLEALKSAIQAYKPSAIAINLLFSYINSDDERAIADQLSDAYFVSRSSEVLPEIGEYERGVTTFLNASLGPLVAHYLERLQHAIAPSQLAIMQSSGLTLAADQAAKHSVRLFLSGPAGGLIGAQTTLSASNIMTFDMGGTSTDVSLIDEDLSIGQSLTINGLPIPVPAIDIATIGAGGGSIASIDPGGLLKVGPESAGADPGPACYGMGGLKATVTDANVVLGRLPVDQPLAGGLRLKTDLAVAAISDLGQQLNLSVEETAAGIITLANERMAEALRSISIQKGHHPKDFTLCCFGGAGGLHLCELCDRLGIPRALVPAEAGIFSALGMLAARPGREKTQGINQASDQFSDQDLSRVVLSLSNASRQELAQEGISATEQEVFLDFRYLGQNQTLSIAYQGDLHSASDQFEALHEARYGHRLATLTELVSVRVRLVSRPRLTQLAGSPASSDSPLSKGQSEDSERCSGRVASNLNIGSKVEGPIVVTGPHTSIWVAEGWQAERLSEGHLQLTPGRPQA